MLLLIAAASGVLVYGMIAALLGTILPELSKKLSLGPAQMGRIALSQAVGLVLASIAVGPMIGLTGKQITLVAALAIVGFGLFSLPRSKSFGGVATMMFVIGFGGGIIVAAANSLTDNMGNEMSAMLKTNILNSFFGLGGLLTPFLAANLLKGDSNKLLTLITAVTAISLVLCLIGLGGLPGPTGGDPFAGAGQVLGNGSFWLVSLLFFFYIACEVGVWNWLVQHLVAQGIPEKNALNVLSLGFALGLLLGRLVVVPLLPKDLSPVQVTLGAAVLMMITTFLMLQVKSPTAAAATVFVGGLAMAPVFPNCIAITLTMFQNPTALGLALVFGWLGLAVSSPIIGALGGGDTKKLKTALLVLPAMSAVMIAISLVLLGAAKS
jgi:fucose permease